MKKEIFLILMLCAFSYGVPDLQVSAKLDHNQAMRVNVLQITISNNGTEATSRETTAVFNWYCCANRTYEVPVINAGEYKTITDVLIFPDAGRYTLRIVVDPENRVGELNEGNNVWEENETIILPDINARPARPLDFGSEPVVQVSCEDTDLMKIGRVVRDGGYERDGTGRLERDRFGDGDVWLPAQRGNGCGSTSLAYILRYLGLGEYTQSDVDDHIRMSWGDGSFSDPFSIASYAEGQGAHARVYVDGSIEKLEWFIDHNIPVMIAISTKGSTDVMDGHWVVAVSHCLRERRDAPGTYERVIGIYNPWGYQQEITYERFEQYWRRQDLGAIPLWNRVYVAVYRGDAPAGMPESNVDGWTGLKMNAGSAISQFLVGIQDIGDGFIEMFTGDFWSGLGQFLTGIGEAIVGLVVSLVLLIVTIIVQVLTWIWEGLVAFGCWIASWFGYDCDGTPHYYKHTLFSSHPCAEGGVFLNGFMVQKPVGYVYNEEKEGTAPLFQYAKMSNSGEILGYVVSKSGTLTESDGHPLELLGLLGYLYSTPTPNSTPMEEVLAGRDIEIVGTLGYIENYKTEETRLLWMFADANNKTYLSRDQCAGTKSFPFALSGGDKSFFWVYTRQYIVGYIYQNEQERSIPLFRFYDRGHQTFYPTTNLTEGFEKGYQYSGLIGYLNLPQPPRSLPTTAYMQSAVCKDGEVFIYRYRNRNTGDYTIETSERMGPDFEDGTKLGCINTCPTNCTMPLWIFTTQEIRKE